MYLSSITTPTRTFHTPSVAPPASAALPVIRKIERSQDQQCKIACRYSNGISTVIGILHLPNTST